MFRFKVVLLFGTIVLFAACAVRAGSLAPVGAETAAVVVTPVKAHLLDGSTILYPAGIKVEGDSLIGVGTRYDLLLRPVGTVERMTLDSVAGMENYRTGYNIPVSVLLTAVAIPSTIFAGMGLYVAIFGSCPTFYVDVEGTPTLQAEGFSYSIAPLLESRDVDRLGAVPDAEGNIVLEVRNEALETHFVNHLELLEVQHATDEWVVSDNNHRLLAVGPLQEPAGAVDRAGRPLVSILSATDGRVFETDERTLRDVRVDDLHDQLDLVFPAPVGVDSVALVFRLRNSLLTTILLYDVMLGAAGPQALNWLGQGLQQVGTAIEFAQWYNRQMGLHLQVWRNGKYEALTRLSETGPIAWKDVAIVVPVEAGSDSVRVRLRFVADNWRIDRIGMAARVRRAQPVILPPVTATLADGQAQPEAVRALLDPDEDYLETSPGQRYFVTFESTPPTDKARTYLIASQGYYTEWMRPQWLRARGGMESLRPSDSILLEALDRWRTRKPGFEEEFYSSAIPVE